MILNLDQPKELTSKIEDATNFKFQSGILKDINAIVPVRSPMKATLKCNVMRGSYRSFLRERIREREIILPETCYSKEEFLKVTCNFDDG